MKKNETLFLIQRADFGISKLLPATKDEITASEFNMKKSMPNDLIEFYMEVSNGMTFGRLHIFPVLSKNNLKKLAILSQETTLLSIAIGSMEMICQ